MVKFPTDNKPRNRDSTVALINIVFLMLVFFLIAGTIAPPLDKNISPILGDENKKSELSNAISVREDGQVYYEDKLVEVSDLYQIMEQAGDGDAIVIRILADKNLPAIRLVEIINQLQQSKFASIRVITERKTDG